MRAGEVLQTAILRGDSPPKDNPGLPHLLSFPGLRKIFRFEHFDTPRGAVWSRCFSFSGRGEWRAQVRRRSDAETVSRRLGRPLLRAATQSTRSRNSAGPVQRTRATISPIVQPAGGFLLFPLFAVLGLYTMMGTALPRLGARAGGVGIIRRSERSERSEPPENDKKKTVYHLLDRLPFLDSRIANEAREMSAARRFGSGYPLTMTVTAFIVYYKTATKSSPDAKKRPAIAGLIQTASGFQARSPCIPSRCDTPTRGSSVHTA